MAVALETKMKQLGPIIHKSTQDFLTCFHCKTYIRSGPIYKCLLTKQTTCSKCTKRERPGTCPHKSHYCEPCNFDFPWFLRCKLSETLRDTLPIPCKNALNGCEVALFKEDLNGHEELCIFRNIICANLKCNEKPVFKDYIDHFNANHVIDGDDLNGQEDCKVFKADFTMKEAEVGHARRFAKFGRNFFDFGFLYAKEPCHERILRRWLLFQGSPSEAKNFVYESSLSSPDGCKIITVGQVVSLDEQHFKKTKFKIFADIAESFAQENGFLNFTMKIRNLKEEAKDDDDESGVSDVECSD